MAFNKEKTKRKRNKARSEASVKCKDPYLFWGNSPFLLPISPSFSAFDNLLFPGAVNLKKKSEMLKVKKILNSSGEFFFSTRLMKTVQYTS